MIDHDVTFYVVCQEYGRRFGNKAKRKMVWGVCKLPNGFTVGDKLPDGFIPEGFAIWDASRPTMIYGPFDSDREAGAAMVDQWNEQETLLDADK